MKMQRKEVTTKLTSNRLNNINLDCVCCKCGNLCSISLLCDFTAAEQVTEKAWLEAASLQVCHDLTPLCHLLQVGVHTEHAC